MTAADALIRALRRGMVILLAVVLVRSLVFLRANAGVYEPAALEWAAFGLLVAIAVAVGFLSRGGRHLTGSRWWLTGLTVIASVLATAAMPADRLLTSAHWSWYIVGWFFVAIQLGGRIDVAVWTLSLHLVLVIAQVQLIGPMDRRDVAELVIRSVLFTGAQLAFATAGRVANRASRAAGRIREREARATTARQIADEVMRDRRQRHATVAATTVPLLEGLASGRMSPADPAVRRECMVEATRLRRLMAESDQNPNPLNHELRACVDVAERAGVQVDVAFRGAGPSPGLDSRRRLTEPVIAVLAEAHEYARVTVVGTSRDIVVSVVAPVTSTKEFDVRDVSGPAEQDVEVTVVNSPGQIWVTARWEAA